MGKPLRVLVVEDSEDEVLLLMRELRQGGYEPSFERVATEETMMSAIANQTWDIIIADYIMPHFSGLEALRVLQKSGRDLPFIIVSGKISEDTAVEVMKAGAHDYMSKNNLKRFIPAVERELGEAKMRRQHQQTGKALRRSEASYRTIFDSANDAIFLHDPKNGKILDVNRKMCEMYSYTYDETLKIDIETISEGKPPYSQKEAAEWLRKAFEIGPQLFEWRAKDKYGRLFWVETSLKRAVIGGRECILAIVRDITNRKQTEEKLKKSEMMLKSVVNAVPIGIEVVADRKITWTNDNFLQLIGRTQEEIIGRDTRILYVDDEGYNFIGSQYYKDLKEKGNAEVEIKWRHKDGRILDVFLTGVPLDVKEMSRGVVFGVLDITERKQAEEKIKKALEVKSKFISVVSHELRTPLTAIKEGIALVADRVVGEINDEQKELLDISKRNVDRLARLINNVLDLQKLDSGIMKFNVEKGDINEVAKEVYETMAVSVKNAGLLFSLELDSDLPKCSFDNDRIIQVLTNLVTNAIKFTAKGSIAIKTGKTKDAVQVSVSDTGCGIRKEDLPEVFGRFEQLDHGGGRKTGGAGLGLAISREIVEWHKGEIWVESTCEKGSKFSFTLPLRQLKKNAENSPGQSITIA